MPCGGARAGADTMTERLTGSRELWDGHARRDPLWAILSDPAKKGGRWDLSGSFRPASARSRTSSIGCARQIAVVRRRALDFGCGVGRLSQALAQHFARVDGVDISPAMVGLARSLNRHGERVSYHANDRPDLSIFADGTFDFIVTSIVLQHIEPVDRDASYLAELCRVLAAGGAIVFQAAGAPTRPQRSAAADEQDRRISDVPDEAYRACFPSPAHPPAKCGRATRAALEVELANASAFEWSRGAFGIIRVGNHWFDASGYAMVIADDGRTGIPEPLFPGDRCKVALTATAPRDCGDYWCEIDLAHEGVVWFRERGSRRRPIPRASARGPREARRRRRRQRGALPADTGPAAEISTAHETAASCGMTADGI